MNISFQNSNNSEYEKLLNELMLKVFGFSFAAWHEKGLWTDDYESYAVIEGGRMLANICLFKTEIIHEQKFAALQLGAVATDPDYRGRGLSGALMRHVLELYPAAPMFLFANKSVLDYYPRFGFRRIFEDRPLIDYRSGATENNARKLSPDDPIMQRYLDNGRKSSAQFYCANAQSIEWFHFLISYADHIYHIPHNDTLTIAIEQDDEIFIPYLNAPAEADFNEIFQALPFPGKSRLRFGFMPDPRLGRCRWEVETSDDEAMFVRGDFPLPKTFAFPAMSKT